MMSFAANHLWQSTVFAAFAWLLTLVLRRNSARVRHWIWLAASIKFLIPFSLLISVGAHVPPVHATPPPRRISTAVARASEPFSVPVPAYHIPVEEHTSPILPVLWFCGLAGVSAFWFIRWRRVRSIVKVAIPIDLRLPIPAMSAPAPIEPGVFGVFRPILLLPEGIEQRLTPSQLRAVVAHELCHVRRRDNFAAAFHMLVEALFWFHPLVWWIGARLVNERERACDEAVLAEGSEREAYAEGILSVCRLYLESPLPCVAGVTGADLRKRVEAIMTNGTGVKLSMRRKLLLAAATFAAVSLPIAVGIVHAQSTPRFEVVSIKPNHSGSTSSDLGPPVGNRFVATNIYVKRLLRAAYGLQDFHIKGGPDWIESERFDILANADRVGGNDEQFRLMLQSLLADRFRMKAHREANDSQILALTVDAGGPKMRETKCEKEASPGGCRTAVTSDRSGSVTGRFVPVAELASILQTMTGRIVQNRTGLSARFDVELKWSPTLEPGDDASGPSLSTALREQLGLKLESTRGEVEMLLIDHIERPSEN